MSLASVRAFFAEHAPEIEVLEATTSTATVALAAAAHGIEPDRIAKTLSLRVYADASLRAYDFVVPAAGDTHHAVKIAPERLVQLTGAEWVDVAEHA